MGDQFQCSIEELRTVFENYSNPPDLAPLSTLGGVHAVAKKLNTNVVDGLYDVSEEAMSARTQLYVLSYSALILTFDSYGVNVFPRKPMKSWFFLFFNSLEDSTLIILCVAAAVSLALELTLGHDDYGWLEAIAILIAVIVVALVTSTNEFQKQIQFRRLNAVKDNKPVKVIRNGTPMDISIHYVVVGDVVKLDMGDAIPADGILLENHDLKTDESAMTGEIIEIRKGEHAPLLLSGTAVCGGAGTMLVVAVGPHSEWGMTLKHLTEDSDETPLQERLETLANTIGTVGLVMALLTFVAAILWWVIPSALTRWSLGVPFQLFELENVVKAVILAVTIVVVAVPEGLPLAVTISLAYSMKQMMKENNLVRHLEACETMGGATNICSDKTGTLTENRMTVVEAYLDGKQFHEAPTLGELPSAFLDHLIPNIALNGSSFLTEKHSESPLDALLGNKPKKTPEEEAAKRARVIDIMKLENSNTAVIGSKTEGALLMWARDLSFDYSVLRKETPMFRLWPFNSEKKRSAVMVRTLDGFRLLSKGGADVIIHDCEHMLARDGTTRPMDDAARAAVLAAATDMASRGLRCLVLATRTFAKEEAWPESEPAPDDALVFTAMVGIKDPVRKEVPDAVRLCMEAGITVRMVTGDSKDTARFIARECRILDEQAGHTLMEGPVFRQLTRRQMREELKTLRVLARSSPSDKHLLVSTLREMGEVVAVTGDGTNDAPALKVADVGLSMGIAGTDVAKEASDIVILDDNFSSIVAAVKWGRGVYDNIRKFVQFQLTVNVVALIVAFIGVATQRGSPLTAIQLLWVNLIMDSLAALALGTEVPDNSLLKRKPHGRFEPLISNLMWRQIIGNSIYQIVVLFGVVYLGPYVWSTREGSLHHYTLVFNSFVMCQLFNELSSRNITNELNYMRGITKSPVFVIVILSTLVVQVLFVHFGGVALNVDALTIAEWFACVGIGAFSLVLGVYLRTIPVPLRKRAVDEKQSDEDKALLDDDDSESDADDLDDEGRVLREELTNRSHYSAGTAPLDSPASTPSAIVMQPKTHRVGGDEENMHQHKRGSIGSGGGLKKEGFALPHYVQPV